MKEESVAITGNAGHNLKVIIADLERRMRDAAADLEFEAEHRSLQRQFDPVNRIEVRRARLRDELKKLLEKNLDLIG